MRYFNRFAGLILLLFFSYSLATLSIFSLLVRAQEPTPLEIRIIPHAEYAVSGQPFTYTIIITHVSRENLKDIIIFMETPIGTTFASTQQNANWFVTSPLPGQVGKIGWTTLESISPGEVITFTLSVNILEAPNKQLINEKYGIVPMGGGDIIASGPPLKTQVLTPTPTVTSRPSPTTEVNNTPLLVTATFSPTPLKATHTLTPSTPLAQVASTPIPHPTQPAMATSSPLKTSVSLTVVFTIIGSIIVVGFVAVVWFLRHR